MSNRIKLSSTGEQLPADATDHAIVQNTVTGLQETVNAPGFEDRMTFDDSEKAIAKLNADAYLGHGDWRLPTPNESHSGVEYKNADVLADLSLYPDMKPDWYWTDQVVPWSSGYVFCAGFYYGDVGSLNRLGRAFVRPVRSVSPSQ
jgi:hypothetical protein